MVVFYIRKSRRKADFQVRMVAVFLPYSDLADENKPNIFYNRVDFSFCNCRMKI